MKNFALVRKNSLGSIVEHQCLWKRNIAWLWFAVRRDLYKFLLKASFKSVKISKVHQAGSGDSPNRVAWVNRLGKQSLFLEYLWENELDFVVVALIDLSELLSGAVALFL